LAFLIRRFEQLRALDLGPRSNKTVVADYIFEKDKLFACLNLNDQELDTYNRYFNYFREQTSRRLTWSSICRPRRKC
jgi:deoxyguanosine kinase